MKKIYFVYFILTSFPLFAQISAVGIGTTNPQQSLHLENSIGTLRVESLDKDNNEFNGGNIQPLGTYPLYVDSNGVLTLKLDTFANSDGHDVIDHSTIPQSTIRLTAGNPNGKVDATFYSYTITVTRPSVLEVKYSISYEVLLTDTPTPILIRDGSARRISTYYTLNNGTRRYGQSSRCFMNENINNPAPYPTLERIGATGQLYNSSTTYVQLPIGTHTLNFKAEVSSNLPSQATLVRLAIDTDSVFMRLY